MKLQMQAQSQLRTQTVPITVALVEVHTIKTWVEGGHTMQVWEVPL